MSDEVPPVRSLRWPILVVLDGLGDDEILDLEDRVARHIELSEGARSIADPDTGRALITQRLMQAIEDLYQADAVEPDVVGGSIRITDVGRRLTEAQAAELPDARESGQLPLEDKPSVGSWIATLLETFLP